MNKQRDSIQNVQKGQEWPAGTGLGTEGTTRKDTSQQLGLYINYLCIIQQLVFLQKLPNLDDVHYRMIVCSCVSVTLKKKFFYCWLLLMHLSH